MEIPKESKTESIVIPRRQKYSESERTQSSGRNKEKAPVYIGTKNQMIFEGRNRLETRFKRNRVAVKL